MRFTKMHGLGNDYLYVLGEVPENIIDICIKLSDRHFGAGSDGMIYISPSESADFKMRIFNADGSEAGMCGNGIRCVGKYVFDKGLTFKRSLTIETVSGIRTLVLNVEEGRVSEVSVGMGCAAVGKEIALELPFGAVSGIPVYVGNPHFVVFVDDAELVPLESIGPLIEKHETFPGGVNVEFVQKISDNNLRMRVWERGSGVTLACGTGACASAAAAASLGICRKDDPITVALDGGELEITVSKGFDIMMTGPAETVYEGETEI